MAVQTPIAGSRFDNVDGNLREVIAKFASVADADTWVTGLGSIVSVEVTSGATTSKVIGATISGGTITFRVTSGPDTNTSVTAKGF